ncbi:MAG TPA: hypothetical protein VF796_25145 [Humisphaera sp.]
MSAAADALTDRRPPTSAAAYCRQARRLRCRFRGDTSALHLSLRALAARRDAVRAAGSASAQPFRPSSDANRRPAVVRVTATRAGREPRPSPAQTPASRPGSSVFAASSDAVDWFSSLVAGAVEDGVLRHSARESLFRQAEGLGINRFEANLIMAAVRNRGSRSAPAAVAATGAASSGALLATAVVLLVQSAVALAAWCFWHA